MEDKNLVSKQDQGEALQIVSSTLYKACGVTLYKACGVEIRPGSQTDQNQGTVAKFGGGPTQ
jgi:hypothetical protein